MVYLFIYYFNEMVVYLLSDCLEDMSLVLFMEVTFRRGFCIFQYCWWRNCIFSSTRVLLFTYLCDTKSGYDGSLPPLNKLFSERLSSHWDVRSKLIKIVYNVALLCRQILIDTCRFVFLWNQSDVNWYDNTGACEARLCDTPHSQCSVTVSDHLHKECVSGRGRKQ